MRQLLRKLRLRSNLTGFRSKSEFNKQPKIGVGAGTGRTDQPFALVIVKRDDAALIFVEFLRTSRETIKPFPFDGTILDEW
jgi:uncharacterized spore protein YtfJ